MVAAAEASSPGDLESETPDPEQPDVVAERQEEESGSTDATTEIPEASSDEPQEPQSEPVQKVGEQGN